MVGYRLPLCVALGTLVLLCACGGTPASPSELIVGTWDAEARGETLSIEFGADGTVLSEGQDLQRYVIIEGDPNLVRIMGMNSDMVALELELEFRGENECTLSGEGLIAELTRVR